MAEIDDIADVTVKVEKTGSSRLQWVSVVGVGTFLIVAIVPWMMNMISANTRLISTTMQDNTVAITSMTEQSEDVERAIRANTRVLEKLGEQIQVDE